MKSVSLHESMAGWAAIAVAMLCASAPAASCTWTNTVVNTPATAYNWSDSGNWKDGMVPNAYDKAVLPSTAVYINLPDGVVASNVSIGATYLMGSKLRIEGNVSGLRRHGVLKRRHGRNDATLQVRRRHGKRTSRTIG